MNCSKITSQSDSSQPLTSKASHHNLRVSGPQNGELTSPVDLCAGMTRHLFGSGETAVCRCIDNDRISSEDTFDAIGKHIERLPYHDWMQRAVQSPHLGSSTAIFTDQTPNNTGGSTFETLSRMEQLKHSNWEVKLPERDVYNIPPARKMLNRYLGANKDISKS